MDGFQHEQPDYWLNFGNPWEIERLNVGYPIKFYGHVSVHEEDGRQIFRWNPGEAVWRCARLFLRTLLDFRECQYCARANETSGRNVYSRWTG